MLSAKLTTNDKAMDEAMVKVTNKAMGEAVDKAKRLIKQTTALCKVLAALLLLTTTFAHADKPSLAFDGALGFGKYTQGGTGGARYTVTRLDDDNKPGSLRYGIKQKHPRMIDFAVSGIIKLSKPLNIDNGYLTVNGQSSPNGIVIAGAPVKVHANQVIIRYLRFRLGTFGYDEDALTVRYSKDVIIDHCSMSWSVDETASMYGNENFTLQNSLIANSLNDSIHPKGKHGYGGIWGGKNASFINNIIANHASRTPRINGHRLGTPYPQQDEFIELNNNLIYNWGSNNVYGSENGRFHLINNYYLPGPNSKAKRILDLWHSDKLSQNQAYIIGNVYFGQPQWNNNNLAAVVVRDSDKNKNTADKFATLFAKAPLMQSSEPLWQSAEQLSDYLAIQQNAGATLPKIDSIDAKVYQQIRQGKTQTAKQGIINHELEQITSWDDYAKEFTDKRQPLH